MDGWELAIYGVAAFFASIFSGMIGGGAGFITTPLLILLGLTPAEAVSSGKFNGLALTIGSLFGMRKARGQVSRSKVLFVMALAAVIGLLAPFAIKSLDSDTYRIALGIILLLMVPLIIVKKVGVARTEPSNLKKVAGGFLLSIAMGLQAIFAGGIGTLVNLVLIGMLDMTPLEANMTKRWSQPVLNGAVILGVLGSGLIVWNVVAVGASTVWLGGYIGGRLAMRKDDTFIMRVMVLFMTISALALIFGG